MDLLTIQRKHNPLAQNICILVTFYLALASILPQIRALQGYNTSTLIAMLVWVICAALAHPDFFRHKMIIIFYLLYTILIPMLFGNSIISHRYVSFGQVLIFYLIYQYNRIYRFECSSIAIIKWSVPFIIYTCIRTLYGLIGNPYLSRSIKTSDEYSLMLRLQGIGGYETIYFLVFITILMLFLLLNKNILSLSFHYNIGVYMLLILSALTVIYSNYFIALIMVIISFATLLLTKKRNTINIIIGVFISIGLIFQANRIFLIITNLLIKLLGGGKTSERLISLQMDIYGYAGQSLISERIPAFILSWNSFLDNPIFGMIIKPILYNGNYLLGFGQHSQLLDTFALYGMFIGLITIYLIIQPFISRFKRNKVLFSLNLSIFISVIILFTMNNYTPSIGFAIFFIYPVLYDWLHAKIDLEK